MSKSKPLLSSTLGKKLIMSLTGIFLCLFLVVHLIGNLQLFKDDAGYAFNTYAHFMTNFTPIKIVSILLYLTFVLHAVYALVITRKNKAARPIGYNQSSGNANSKWNSRNMGILGTIILIFLVTHMQNFWWKYHNDQVPYVQYEKNLDTQEVTSQVLSSDEFTNYLVTYKTAENGDAIEVIKSQDLYQQVEYAFENIGLVLLYVIAMAALSFHLIHGFQSAFQTLGFKHRRYIGTIRFLGIWVFGVIIPIAFAAIPVYIYLVR